MSTESEKKLENDRLILVIDDEPEILRLLERILTGEGFRVMLATDGVYGLSLLKEEEPDLVILDILMPGPDGFTVLNRIREISNVPVIMVTGKRDTDSVQRAIDQGADDYVRKPFRPAELVARVRSKLRRV
jgi:two-component system response regulator MtrA